MAISVRSRLDELLAAVEELYIEDQDAKNIRTTGASADSIKRTINDINGDISGEVTGVGYFRQQRHGRAPGKFPPIQDIETWIRNKGIRPSDGKTSIKSLAFLFARKIAESGTDIYQKKRPPLDVSQRISELVAKFRSQVAKDRIEEMKQLIKV